jgi:hypothetical protein
MFAARGLAVFIIELAPVGRRRPTRAPARVQLLVSCNPTTAMSGRCMEPNFVAVVMSVQRVLLLP